MGGPEPALSGPGGAGLGTTDTSEKRATSRQVTKISVVIVGQNVRKQKLSVLTTILLELFLPIWSICAIAFKMPHVTFVQQRNQCVVVTCASGAVWMFPKC